MVCILHTEPPAEELKRLYRVLWHCFGLNGEKMLSLPAVRLLALNPCVKGNKFGKGAAFSYLCAILRRNIHFL